VLTVICLFLWVAIVVWLMARRSFVFYALVFLLFSFTWRLVSSSFIDLAGPVYSPQLNSAVGPGNCASVLFLAYGLVVVVFMAMFRGEVLSRFRRSLVAQGPVSSGVRRLAWVFFSLFAFLMVVLFFDLLRIGIIPLLEGMERYEYTRKYGGVLHGLLFRFAGLWGFSLGVLFVYPALRGGKVDLRFFWILLASLFYAFLTGHRFSGFFVFVSFFVMGAAMLSVRSAPRSVPLRVLLLGGGIAGTLILLALVHSYGKVRVLTGGDPFQSLVTRILIEQGELWALSFRRVFFTGNFGAGEVAHFLFQRPIDPQGNTTIQFLMWKAIGFDAQRVLSNGQQFAGGFPEIQFEALGPRWAWGMIALQSVFTAFVLRETYFAQSEGRPLTVFLGMYVSYSFLISLTSGMLNFLVNPTFWLKMASLGTVSVFERIHGRTGRSLLADGERWLAKFSVKEKSPLRVFGFPYGKENTPHGAGAMAVSSLEKKPKIRGRVTLFFWILIGWLVAGGLFFVFFPHFQAKAFVKVGRVGSIYSKKERFIENPFSIVMRINILGSVQSSAIPGTDLVLIQSSGKTDAEALTAVRNVVQDLLRDHAERFIHKVQSLQNQRKRLVSSMPNASPWLGNEKAPSLPSDREQSGLHPSSLSLPESTGLGDSRRILSMNSLPLRRRFDEELSPSNTYGTTLLGEPSVQTSGSLRQIFFFLVGGAVLGLFGFVVSALARDSCAG
jgi:hypothetical protein